MSHETLKDIAHPSELYAVRLSRSFVHLSDALPASLSWKRTGRHLRDIKRLQSRMQYDIFLRYDSRPVLNCISAAR